MCGRYTLHTNKKKLAEAIAKAIPETYAPDYNIAPGSDVLSISNESTAMMQWGLKTPQNFHVNARLEKADSTPRFRDAWEENRCLIPANGFYEWLNDGIRKQPYYIHSPLDDILYFAGLWFPSSVSDLQAHCVILTMEANNDVHDIHQRMPVCLSKNLHQDWLRNTLPKDEVLAFASKASFAKHTVSTRVNSTQNKDSRLIVATAPQNDEQMQLF
ncbi:SOS response-associated peptidase [Coraliomargarita akajimensis]|uniref:Abasic site processing protein n=1 Tax=Coraliomargarita akajimensis (strain DSM 45221 / IAM 15411 / JCM 23193 / KCTC 12865 / 04OKA010-24) TaxID=583355 RepID=D5EQG0_CORAD|nr:SOS response-associated peptidase [Coraliomargarita akajimensis]ADE55774.1 protein of unknown function DUF159 [Coraliomargarita akajimensis DSM 45221]